MTTKTFTLRTGLDAVLRWDAILLAAVARFDTRVVRRGMQSLTRAGDTPGWIVHGAVLFLFLSAESPTLVAMALAAVLATIASQIAKRLFRRPRPTVSIPGFQARLTDPDPFSFPSGHSTVAFAIATAAAAGNPVLGGVETLLAALIAASRIYLGAHYPVDVLGGIALGVVCGMTSWSLLG